MALLEREPFSGYERRLAREVSREQLERVHTSAHIDRIFSAAPDEGLVSLDPDTWMSRGSLEAAARAAGGVCDAVEAVGEARRVFVAVRPPGHHAEAERAMGFCLFNNVAVGAAHARATIAGVERVAIVDFDVHHGNGTQDIFAGEAAVAYASSHQYPYYPGSGAREERGVGNIFNAPLPARSGSATFRAAWSEELLPKLEGFAPNLLMISAGFDAHQDDPLGGLGLETKDFAWLTRELVGLADRCAEGRVVSVLEGGYSLEGLSASVAAHLEALAEDSDARITR